MLAGPIIQSYASSVVRVLKQVHCLAELDEFPREASASLLSTEQSYRLDLVRILNHVHGEIQAFNRTKDLYVGTVKSLLD